MTDAEPSLVDLSLALAGLQDRCLPSDADAIKRAVLNRSKELGSYFRQLTRLVRLAVLCGGKNGYVRFLYLTIPAFRTEYFKETVTAARPDPQLVHVQSDGVVFTELAMLPDTGAASIFDLSFRQMPRLAALLDVLHNTLGYDVLYNPSVTNDRITSERSRGLLWPLTVSPPLCEADEVARRLQSAFGEWLSQALGKTTHELRQAEQISNFLVEREATMPESFTDELLFEFWKRQAIESRHHSDRFRLYRSAVRAMLRYRRSLEDAIAEKRREDAISGKWADIDLDQVTAAEGEEWRTPTLALATPPYEEWSNPMLTLTTPPCDAVKWLTKAERNSLSEYLADESPESNMQRTRDVDRPEIWRALMGQDRFDLRFVRTLLRVNVFGSAQAQITAALRLKEQPTKAVSTALEPITNQSYSETANGYRKIHADVRKTIFAAIHRMGVLSEVEAIFLISRVAETSVVDFFRPKYPIATADGDFLRRFLYHNSKAALEERLISAFGGKDEVPHEVKSFLSQASSAAATVRRDGFQSKQQLEPNVRAAFREAAAALVSLLDEIERLVEKLNADKLGDMALDALAEADRKAFDEVFQQLYL